MARPEGLLIGSGPAADAFVRHHTHGRSGCEHDKLVLLNADNESPVAPGEMGELCFRGPSGLRGYYNAPDANATAFASNGFFRTGDMMRAHVIGGVTYFSFEGPSARQHQSRWRKNRRRRSRKSF